MWQLLWTFMGRRYCWWSDQWCSPANFQPIHRSHKKGLCRICRDWNDTQPTWMFMVVFKISISTHPCAQPGLFFSSFKQLLKIEVRIILRIVCLNTALGATSADQADRILNWGSQTGQRLRGVWSVTVKDTSHGIRSNWKLTLASSPVMLSIVIKAQAYFFCILKPGQP